MIISHSIIKNNLSHMKVETNWHPFPNTNKTPVTLGVKCKLNWCWGIQGWLLIGIVFIKNGFLPINQTIQIVLLIVLTTHTFYYLSPLKFCYRLHSHIFVIAIMFHCFTNFNDFCLEKHNSLRVHSLFPHQYFIVILIQNWTYQTFVV